MDKKLVNGLRWIAAIALGLPLIGAPGMAQTIKSPFQSGGQVGAPPLAVQAAPLNGVADSSNVQMTPWEREFGPIMKDLLAQGASARPKGALAPATTPTGIGGSNVNFPGFLTAPFLTLKDGSSATAFNSVAGDFNKDGYEDVAIIRGDGTIDVILNPGTLAGIQNLSPIISNNNGNPGNLSIGNVIVADMNGDGIPDLVGQDVNNNQIVVWIGKGDGTFAAPKTYAIALDAGANWAYGGGILVGDFNGDGAPDVATYTVVTKYAAKGASTSIVAERTYLNSGTGVLLPLAEQDTTFPDLYATSYGNSAVVTADGKTASAIAILVQDEALNVAANAGLSILVMQSNGDGTFKAPLVPVPII